MLHRRTLGAAALGMVAFLGACDDDDPIEAELGNIVEVAADAGQFNTLLTAATAAGLAGALSDETADLTVFAPTDAAFEALPAGTLDALLADPTGDLADILLYHVIGENLVADDVLAASFIETLNGQSLPVTTPGGVPTVANAAIITTNIEASNGTIHVIDAVMLPETRNIVEVAQDTETLSTLVTAVVTADLAATLSDEAGNFTVFAPTNDAFAALPAGVLDGLLADPAALADILLYHTAADRFFSDEVVAAATIPTVQGTDIPVAPAGTSVTVDGANLLITDIQATNGVVHVIDAVILP